uniref:Uncharacterized protein n=1 Tax=viral metagenome TaxID=1070528 RepID=A0A6M3JH05_9ZZZZ
MSADNFLGIYKENNRRYVARNCFSECEGDCSNCNSAPVFIAKSLTEAVKKAEEELGYDVYEYGYRFFNL